MLSQLQQGHLLFAVGQIKEMNLFRFESFTLETIEYWLQLESYLIVSCSNLVLLIAEAPCGGFRVCFVCPHYGYYINGFRLLSWEIWQVSCSHLSFTFDMAISGNISRMTAVCNNTLGSDVQSSDNMFK